MTVVQDNDIRCGGFFRISLLNLKRLNRLNGGGRNDDVMHPVGQLDICFTFDVNLGINRLESVF